MKRFGNLIGIFAFLFAANACLAEQIDNPAYQAWARFKAGAMVKTKTVTKTADQTSEMNSTEKLVELTPEKAVVETTMSMVVGTKKMDMPAQKKVLTAKVEKPVDPPADPDAPKIETKEGDEDIEVAGQKIKTHWTQITTKAKGMSMISKVWGSESVPGGTAKMEMTMEGQIKSSTTLTVVEMSGN